MKRKKEKQRKRRLGISAVMILAPYKVIRDILGFRIPRCGFWIPGTELRIPPQWVPDSKRARFQIVIFGQTVIIAFRFPEMASLGGGD